MSFAQRRWQKLGGLIKQAEPQITGPHDSLLAELLIDCQFASYPFGDLFLQVLRLRLAHADDERMQRRTADLIAILRAQVWSDAAGADESETTVALADLRKAAGAGPASL